MVSLDWKWLFIYPQQKVASVNHMVVPAGVPLQSQDHLRERVQRVLRAAARQRDLRHVRHDDRSSTCRPTTPASTSASRLTSAAMASPTWHFDVHAVSPEQFAGMGRGARAPPVRCWMRPPTGASSSRVRTSVPTPIGAVQTGSVRRHRAAEAAAGRGATDRADRRRQLDGTRAEAALTCSGS